MLTNPLFPTKKIFSALLASLILLNPCLNAWSSQIAYWPSSQDYALRSTQGFFDGALAVNNSYPYDLVIDASGNCGSDTDVERYYEAYQALGE
ncbi:MAG: hypothetical protein HY547_06300 [Elusimicrobia bacterium]|nr:hypothetical protein [Elusimicrobiota bacterium]